MCAVWPDEYVCAARILPPQPAECRVDLLGAPATAEQHQSIRPEECQFRIVRSPSRRAALRTTDRVTEALMNAASAGTVGGYIPLDFAGGLAHRRCAIAVPITRCAEIHRRGVRCTR